jgi:hypothetical protein
MRKIYEKSCVHELGIHLVFCTKYRKAIFTGTVEVELKEILGQTRKSEAIHPLGPALARSAIRPTAGRGFLASFS